MFCRFLFVMLSVLRYKDSDYPFGIFKLFLYISCFPHDIVIQICIYFIPPPTQKKLLTHSLYLGRVEFFLSFPERWSCNTCLFFYRLSKLQKGCTRLTAQVITYTSCLPMVGGSLRVLWLLPPLKWSP